MDILLNITISIVVGGISAFGVIKFLGKSWVDNWFAKDLKKYEQQLDLLKMQKQLQYSNVYTKRAEIILNIYQGLMRISMVDSTIRAMKFKDEKHKNKIFEDYSKIYLDCYSYASFNSVYLTDSIRENLISLLDTIGKDIIPQLEGVNDSLSDDYLKMVGQLPTLDARSIMQNLLKEFQEILGIYKDNNQSND